MHSRALEVVVGMFVCLGVAAIFVLTFRVASANTVSGGATYSVHAEFENIGSLSSGASVKLAGVRIGRVTGINIDPTTFDADVHMSIAAEHNNIPIDSSAKILTAGLLGEQYIGIEPGGSEQNLKNGDQMKFTQSAFILENLLGQLLVSMSGNKSNQGPSGGGGNNAAPADGQAAAPPPGAAARPPAAQPTPAPAH
jgi:phospholipid/cholesterol/gamma-HCH transport system substrate-binding protein